MNILGDAHAMCLESGRALDRVMVGRAWMLASRCDGSNSGISTGTCRRSLSSFPRHRITNQPKLFETARVYNISLRYVNKDYHAAIRMAIKGDSLRSAVTDTSHSPGDHGKHAVDLPPPLYFEQHLSCHCE